jgi:hypothetical protein
MVLALEKVADISSSSPQGLSPTVSSLDLVRRTEWALDLLRLTNA